jgi:thioredoxin-dependent peroxiredoxin
MAKTAFQGNPVNTVGDVPAPGSSLPSFTLTGATLSDIGNNDFAGKRVVFNIFPSVDTPVCASSVRKFNELASDLDNTVVLCVSADLPFAQGRFCGSEGLTNVQNASSFRSDFGKAFGVGLNEGAFAGLLARAVVVADESGKVLHTELVADISHEPNYDAAIAALKK